MKIPNDLELNKIFVVEKQHLIMRWKPVIHPYFPDTGISIVRDHRTLKNGECTEDDLEHITGNYKTLEDAYVAAFLHS
jgi:hypothetical protein